MKNKTEVVYSVIAFVLPAVMLTAVLTANGIYPFGDKSLLIYDLRSQYVDFFASLRDSENIFYSFERAFGGDVFTLTAYYLISPFSVVFFLPWLNVTGAVTAVFYLKIMTAGLTFYLFLRRTRLFRICIGYAPFLALIYAFCGFAVMYAQNIMWLDALWLLPLVALTAEILVSDGKTAGFAFTAASAMVINFYMGFMLLAFSFAYVMFLRLTLEHDGGVRTFLRYNTAVVTGVCCSSAVVYTAYYKLALTKMSGENLLLLADGSFFNGIPELFGLLFYALLASCIMGAVFILLDKRKSAGKRGSAKPATVCIAVVLTAGLAVISAVLHKDLFAASVKKYLPYVYDLDSPQLYCSSVCVILTAVLAAVWIKQRGIKAPQYMILILWTSLPLIVPELDLLLHSGQKPISFPGRYSFIISFAVILTAAYTLSVLKPEQLRGFIPSFCIFSASVIIVFELTSNAVWAFRYNENVYFGYYPQKSYENYIAENKAALKTTGDHTRTEKTYYRYLNDSMALDYRGLSHYSSVYNRPFIAEMRGLGYAASEYWSSYFGSTPVLDSLFGIDYLLDMTDADYKSRMLIKSAGQSYASELYEKTYSDGLIDVYRNPSALPAAYEADTGFLNAPLDGANPFERQNRLVSAMTGREENLFVPQTASGPSYAVMEYAESGRFGPRVRVSYHIVPDTDGMLFMYLNSGGPVPCRIYANGKLFSNYQSSQAGIAYTVYLGSYGRDEEVEIKLEPVGTELDPGSADFYALKSGYASVLNRLFSGAAEVSPLSGNKVQFKAKEGSLLFTSIPYEEGWAAADGGGEIAQAAGFLCVDLNEGCGTAEIVYTPPGFARGCVLSGAGLCLWVLMIRKERKGKKSE